MSDHHKFVNFKTTSHAPCCTLKRVPKCFIIRTTRVECNSMKRKFLKIERKYKRKVHKKWKKKRKKIRKLCSVMTQCFDTHHRPKIKRGKEKELNLHTLSLKRNLNKCYKFRIFIVAIIVILHFVATLLKYIGGIDSSITKAAFPENIITMVLLSLCVLQAKYDKIL